MTRSFIYLSLCSRHLPRGISECLFFIPLCPLPLLCVLIDLITTRPSLTYLLTYFWFFPPELHEGRGVILVTAVSPVPGIVPVIQ